MDEAELKGYILGFLTSKGFKIRPEDVPTMKSIFKGVPDWMICMHALLGFEGG